MLPFLLAGAFVLFALSAGSSSSSSSSSKGVILFRDLNGIEWRIFQVAPNLWGSATDGYGGRWKDGVIGSVSLAQEKKTIQQNARMRDPKTGDIVNTTPSFAPEDDYL